MKAPTMKSAAGSARTTRFGSWLSLSGRLLMGMLLSVSMFPFCLLEKANAAEDSADSISEESAQPLSQLEAVENELVVVYEDDPVGVSELNEGTSPGVEVVEKETVAEKVEEGDAVDVVTVSDDTDIDVAIEELAENPQVAVVEPNNIFRKPAHGTQDADSPTSTFEDAQSGDTSVDDERATDASPAEIQPMTTTTNDPNLGDQYYLSSSGFRNAWDRVKCNGVVTVAVIDDGCMFEHPDLKANVDTVYAFDALRKKPLQSAPSSANNNSHGTAVCGTIAAVAGNGTQIAGASYNAKVLPINVFGPDGTAAYSTIIEALAYLERIAISASIPSLKVINMSFGAYAENDIALDMRDRLERLRYRYGMLPVAAGGNGDKQMRPILQKSYPADYDVCMSVTSLDRWGSNSTWCDYNEYKDIAAPGEGILATSNDGGTRAASGTSLSSPIVAAAAALVFAAKPSLTPTQVENALKQTATAVTGNARPQSGSAGALNVKAATDLVLSGAPISNIPMARYTTMHRMYNPNSGEHFYTASAYERDALVRAGWRYEGAGWNAPLTGNPVYRLYNPNAGDHHYTPSAYERDSLVRAGWRYEGVGWNTSVAEMQPLYRLYNPNAATGTHHYTLSAYEATHLTFVGWRYEGIGWFGTD